MGLRPQPISARSRSAPRCFGCSLVIVRAQKREVCMVAPRYDVIGIGNAIVDVIARADDDFLVAQGMHKGGMALIDEARARSNLRGDGPGDRKLGRLGRQHHRRRCQLRRPRSLHRQGQGRRARAHLCPRYSRRQCRVHVKPAKDGPSTARCYIMVTPDGERTMNTYLGAAQDLSPATSTTRRSPTQRSRILKDICGIRRRRRRLSSRRRQSRTRPAGRSR